MDKKKKKFLPGILAWKALVLDIVQSSLLSTQHMHACFVVYDVLSIAFIVLWYVRMGIFTYHSHPVEQYCRAHLSSEFQNVRLSHTPLIVPFLFSKKKWRFPDTGLHEHRFAVARKRDQRDDRPFFRLVYAR